jgi:cytochrome oxidase Cu insertion factor (SCO1/SenC/PrrC family)
LIALRAALVVLTLTFAIALPVAPGLVISAAAADQPLAVGDRAPDLELTDQNGKPFKLSEALAARDYVVLAFFLKAFTGG